MKNTYVDLYVAHYGDGYVVLPDSFSLFGDAASPRTYTALRCDRTGRLLRGKVRVRVDHDATGTDTGGLGDTVVLAG